jgi:hypothetical protein
MKIYKIRDLSTGKYSTGGNLPGWVEDGGKVWLSIGALKSHITGLVNGGTIPISPFWEVIEMEVTEATAYPVLAIAKKKKEG